jgi:glycerol kinase
MLCNYITAIHSCQLLFSILFPQGGLPVYGPATTTFLTSLTAVELILALDAGTTGVRAVAFDPNLAVVDESYRELTQYFPSPGEVEHDPAEIATLAVATLRDVAQRIRSNGHTIVTLGITNQRETTVGFDRGTGQPFHRAIVWQDRRSATICRDLEVRGHGSHVRATTGLVLDSYFSATKMKWLLDHGAADSASRPCFVTVDSWLLYILAGGPTSDLVVTEPSNASRTMLLDLATLEWSPSMMTLFGVERSMLADLQPSASNFGFINADVIPELAGVPITGVLGDQQAALFGQACFDEGLVKATYGTGAFVLVNAGRTVPEVVDGLLTTIGWQLDKHQPATYALEGSAFVAGAAVQWLRGVGIIDAPNELEALARSVPDSAGAQFLPAFSGLGSPFWNPEARGAISGLSQGVERAHIARALVEALAYQVRAITDAFASGGVALSELRADGGVAAMDLLLELQATNSRVAVERSETIEATARGAASIAGLCVGQFNSLEQLATTWRASARFAPDDPTLVDAGYAQWRRALERL